MKSFKQAYDNIFGLGHDCSVAYQLRENDLRKASGPFDWNSTDDLSIITDNLGDRFSRLFLPENMAMDIRQDEESDYYIYTDTATGIKSFHDIAKSGNNITESLIGLNAMFRRRIDRFFELVHKGNKTLFIRKMAPGDDLAALSRALSDIFPGKCVILGVNHVKNILIATTKMSDDVFISHMDCDCDDSSQTMDFCGNFQNWNWLLKAFCELANPTPALPYVRHEGVKKILYGGGKA